MNVNCESKGVGLLETVRRKQQQPWISNDLITFVVLTTLAQNVAVICGDG
jgi:hypothetical protein